MASNLYRLSVRRGPEEGQTFSLTSNSVTVGRDPMAEVVFSDPEVSRQHARFTRTDEGYQLQDLGSTNGTFVDGKRLTGELVTLQPGAVITMGSNVTVVYEAMPDPMATMISADMGLDLPEEEEVAGAAEELRTMIEAPESGLESGPTGGVDDFPGFDDLFEDDAPVYDSDSTAMEHGPVGGVSQAADEEDDFSFDFEDDVYDEPVASPGGFAADDRTVLDMEASDFSYSSQPRQEESLPSFDDSADLPSFEAEPAYTPPQAAAEGPGKMPPPPPPPKQEMDPNRRRNMIIAAVVILLLCCCCAAVVSYFWLGDILLEFSQFQP